MCYERLNIWDAVCNGECGWRVVCMDRMKNEEMWGIRLSRELSDSCGGSVARVGACGESRWGEMGEDNWI